jgi:hypothetical protein
MVIMCGVTVARQTMLLCSLARVTQSKVKWAMWSNPFLASSNHCLCFAPSGTNIANMAVIAHKLKATSQSTADNSSLVTIDCIQSLVHLQVPTTPNEPHQSSIDAPEDKVLACGLICPMCLFLAGRLASSHLLIAGHISIAHMRGPYGVRVLGVDGRHTF